MSANIEESCQHCGHPYSVHFSDDVRGMGSKDPSQVHKGCSYESCQCPGFAPARKGPGTTL
jgi:hypothetical protein